MLKIIVAYASETEQVQVPLEVPDGCLLRQAIERSGVLKQFPEINLSRNKVGVFNELKPLNATLNDGDRIEIYRALKIDPKEIRRLRADRAKKKR